MYTITKRLGITLNVVPSKYLGIIDAQAWAQPYALIPYAYLSYLKKSLSARFSSMNAETF